MPLACRRGCVIRRFPKLPPLNSYTRNHICRRAVLAPFLYGAVLAARVLRYNRDPFGVLVSCLANCCNYLVVTEVIDVPIYEYQCESCSHNLEALQKLSDAPLVDCPACGKSSLKKQISAAGFRLSGGGWYETDFKSGKKKNIAGDAGSSGSGTTAAS